MSDKLGSYLNLMITVIAHIVSVETDSVRVLKMGDTPERNKMKINDEKRLSEMRSITYGQKPYIH